MKIPKHTHDLDEICYPFIYETSQLCDYEILVEDLVRQIGGILTLLPEAHEELFFELHELQPLLHNLKGSIRGHCAITEDNHQWLLACYRIHKEYTGSTLPGFVLPRGPLPVPQLNRASSDTKRLLRLMFRLQVEESIEVSEILFRFCNLLVNYLNILPKVVNRSHHFEEMPLQSQKGDFDIHY
jgi:cob(I)alamin adenosyltransferase